MQNEPELSSEVIPLEAATKDELELKKLALEITELERPWWKRPTYILAALPTLLAVAALSIGFLNGFFSAQLTKLENQRHDLEAEVKEFQGTKTALVSQNDQLRRELEKRQEAIKRIAPLANKLHDVATITRQLEASGLAGNRIGMGQKYALNQRLELLLAELDNITVSLE